MELLESTNEYLVVDGDACLRCSRITGILEASNALAVAEQVDPVCLGVVYGVIGRVEFTSNGPSYLILIKERKQVASHPLKGNPVYRIEKVVAIPLITSGSTTTSVNGNGYAAELELSPCPKHHSPSRNESGVIAGFSLFQKGQKKMAKATLDSLKFVTNKINVRTNSGTKLNEMAGATKEQLRLERRLVVELLRMFNESGSFYYCPTIDLTNSIQRMTPDGRSGLSTWNVDELDSRFIWNSYMLRDLIKQDNDCRHTNTGTPSLVSRWILPVIQGYIGVENCVITIDNDIDQPHSLSPRSYPPVETFKYQLMLISRRSIHRAGTRYIKRGIDAQGHCANYVETEQILLIGDHALAFLQIRGSVPVYWSQPGYKYKPPPVLDRPKADSFVAFQKHFEGQSTLYSNIVAINLVEQSGKEKVLSDAYIDHVLDLDSESIVYVGFDFHEHCRGLKFENIAILTSALEEELAQMRFCWIDKGLSNCRQSGVFRVNCVDCLDRTNVLQMALGRAMLELQLRKFGLLPPEEILPSSCVQAFQHLWACNGDAISRQYAGTAALKGDFTRTGQRNLAGLMKDGYNSANRYYLCHMKDAQRQAVIDAVLGRKVFENDQELENLGKSNLDNEDATDEASWLREKDEQLRLFVRDCERLVVPEGEVILGGWAFINADPGTGDETEDDMDTCVILTRQAYYVADYDEDLDKFVDFQRVPLDDIQKIEVGPMTVAAVLGVPKLKATCLRIYYKIDGSKDDHFHVWRSGSTRLFNNLAIAIKNSDEADEYMKAIAEQFRVALELIEREVSVAHAAKLERKRSKIPPAKLAFRRNAGVFGAPPEFFSSLTSSVSGGMKLFGSRVSSAIYGQSGHGVNFLRLGSNRKKNVRGVDGARSRDNAQRLPLVTLQKYDDSSPNGVGVPASPVFNRNAGLLFGVRRLQESSVKVPTVQQPRRRSDGLSPYLAIHKNDHPTRATPNSDSLETSANNASPDLRLDCSKASQDVGCGSAVISSPLVPSSTSAGTSRSLMKTSHSETSFKPLQSDLLNSTVGQRSLATSQTTLNQVKPVRGSSTNFSFFKRRADDGINGMGDKKFSEFQERIQRSRTRFILL